MDNAIAQPGFTPRAERPVLFLAPMAGVTNSVFRRICKARGADVLTTEFVSAEGILHRNERTEQFVDFTPEEHPLGVQLFGGEPEQLARGATSVVDWKQPDFIDLNFGCPVNKVVCKNGGSSLLRDGTLLAAIASAVVRAVSPLPVTAKIRTGWDEQSVNAADNARRLEDAGIRRLVDRAALDLFNALLEMGVAGVDVAPGVDDRDHRFAHVIAAVVAHACGARTMAEGAHVFRAVPAVAAQFFGFLAGGGRGFRGAHAVSLLMDSVNVTGNIKS